MNLNLNNENIQIQNRSNMEIDKSNDKSGKVKLIKINLTF
jgi:hypothetical protein